MPRLSPFQILFLLFVVFAFLWTRNPGMFGNPGRLSDMLYGLVAKLIILAVSITVHEFGHASVAYALGDPTPKRLGRVSLNPIRHLDPLGTFMILFGPIGWGKPVVWNPGNIVKTNIRIALIAVSLAGIAMNLLLATILYHAVESGPWDLSRDAVRLLGSMVSLNIALAAFNILPIPPLDGYNFWIGVLPPALARFLWPLNQYGFLILIILIMAPGFGGPNLISSLIGPVQSFFHDLVTGGLR
jgi:Zn-dependent protease